MADTKQYPQHTAAIIQLSSGNNMSISRGLGQISTTPDFLFSPKLAEKCSRVLSQFVMRDFEYFSSVPSWI